MACEKCDYVDTILPIDYTKSAFEYANRKLYHTWKMIGMQASHDFVHGKITQDASGHLKGIASGCKPVEEINQNNQLIGRGAWYLRAKSDDATGKSATYGIMGHCQSPGVYSDVQMHIKPTAWEIEDPNFMPFYRDWGLYQGQLFCQCPYNPDWHVAVFVEEIVTIDPFTKETLNEPYKQTYMIYTPDVDCGKKCKGDQECMETCLSQNSRLPGRFFSWLHLGGGKRMTIRTCEAITPVGIQPAPENAVCLRANDAVFTSNDIIGTTEYSAIDPIDGLRKNYGGYGALVPYHVEQGVLIKLTSLPACNHFEKLFKFNDLPDPPDPSNVNIDENGIPMPDGHGGSNVTGSSITGGTGNNRIRCERAALRFAGYCWSNLGWGPCGAYGGTSRRFHFKVHEEHFDRWDRADDGCYKILDEEYDLPEVKFKIRILSHKKEILEKYLKGGAELLKDTEFGQSNWMTKKYLTGGKIADGPTGKMGCKCKASDGENSPYPIRPYTDFNYCPNKFTCEKTCDGTASKQPEPPANSNSSLYSTNSASFDYVTFMEDGGQTYGSAAW